MVKHEKIAIGEISAPGVNWGVEIVNLGQQFI